MWRTGVLSHNICQRMTAPPPFLSKCTLFEKSHFGWWLKNIAKHLCIRVVFVVVCFVVSRFERNRCSCAVHSTLENACTYKVSGCVLGPKGKLSGVSRFQVLEAPDTNLLMWATKTCCCILIHYGAFCGILLQCILCHSVSFWCILMHSCAPSCILLLCNAFYYVLSYSYLFFHICNILVHSAATHSNAF